MSIEKMRSFAESRAIHTINANNYAENNENIERNNKYRENYARDIISEYCDQTIELIKGSHGADFKNSKTFMGEMKSATKTTRKTITGKENLQFQFDKQNDPFRREETLKYEAYSFSVHEKYGFSEGGDLPTQIYYFNEPSAVKEVNKILLMRQEEFVVKCKYCEKIGKKISRDTICITLREVNEICEKYKNHKDVCKIEEEEIKKILQWNTSIIQYPTRAQRENY